MSRERVATASRTVVKVGSSSLTTDGRLDPERLDAIVEVLAKRHAAGQQVVLVSSGAIAAGIGPLGLRARPQDLATQQAAASVGQLLLVERYASSFGRHSMQVGQVLLTVDDLHRRGHYRNASRTLERLLALGVIPIINENNTVATQELRFGDNDRLAALVAHLVQADALVLLSDVDGLYTENPKLPDARRISDIHGPADLAAVNVGGTGSNVGTGGMTTKLDAASIATSAGIPVLLSSAVDVAEALDGRGGTLFHATSERTTLRLFWLEHATTPRGKLVVDAGAVIALVKRRASLIAVGITAVEGDFESGDPVEVAGPDGVAFGRGLVAFDSADLPQLIGRRSDEVPAEFRRVVVHRDDIVLLGEDDG